MSRSVRVCINCIEIDLNPKTSRPVFICLVNGTERARWLATVKLNHDTLENNPITRVSSDFFVRICYFICLVAYVPADCFNSLTESECYIFISEKASCVHSRLLTEGRNFKSSIALADDISNKLFKRNMSFEYPVAVVSSKQKCNSVAFISITNYCVKIAALF